MPSASLAGCASLAGLPVGVSPQLDKVQSFKFEIPLKSVKNLEPGTWNFELDAMRQSIRNPK
jgi:hypothetical protein